MSVHNGFTIEIYWFIHGLGTFLAHATHGAIAISTRRIEDDSKLENESCWPHPFLQKGKV